MEIEVNKIEEIYPGHFQMILDFPRVDILFKIIDVSYKYVWGFNHIENSIEWGHHSFSIFGQEVNNLKLRNVNMEYLLETSRFLELIPFINQSVHLIQTNTIPPFYLNIDSVHGKTRYDLLKDKIDYLFEIEIPGAADFAPIISSNRDFLNRLLCNLHSI